MLPEIDPDMELTSGISDTDDEGDVTVIELEGVRYEIVDTATYNGKDYVAITPFDDNILESDDEDGDFTILELGEDPDDEYGCILKTVDDDELYSEIGEVFLKRFAEEDPEDE